MKSIASPQVRITKARSAVTDPLSTVSCIMHGRVGRDRASAAQNERRCAALVWKNACIVDLRLERCDIKQLIEARVKTV
jgi:hypothetical protein